MGSKCSCINNSECLDISNGELVYIEDKQKVQEETAPIQETSLDDPVQTFFDCPAYLFQNERVKLAENKLPPFKFDPNDGFSSEFLPPEYLPGRTVYIGQKSETGVKHGRGIFLWSDGSKYIGY